MKNLNKKKGDIITEEDLENLSGAFQQGGPEAPWSKIMENTSDEWKAEWRQNLQKKYIPKLAEEDLEELSGAFQVAGSDALPTPWSVIVSNAPSNWKKKWKTALKNKYKDQ